MNASVPESASRPNAPGLFGAPGALVHAAFSPERYAPGASPRLYVPGPNGAVDPRNPTVNPRTPTAAFTVGELP